MTFTVHSSIYHPRSDVHEKRKRRNSGNVPEHRNVVSGPVRGVTRHNITFIVGSHAIRTQQAGLKNDDERTKETSCRVVSRYVVSRHVTSIITFLSHTHYTSGKRAPRPMHGFSVFVCLRTGACPKEKKEKKNRGSSYHGTFFQGRTIVRG